VGIDDEFEKLRQAEEWLNEGCPTIHREAALDHITQALCYTTRADIRTKAFYLLQKANGNEDIPR
jgi:hypothetical protein